MRYTIDICLSLILMVGNIVACDGTECRDKQDLPTAVECLASQVAIIVDGDSKTTIAVMSTASESEPISTASWFIAQLMRKNLADYGKMVVLDDVSLNKRLGAGAFEIPEDLSRPSRINNYGNPQIHYLICVNIEDHGDAVVIQVRTIPTEVVGNKKESFLTGTSIKSPVLSGLMGEKDHIPRPPVTVEMAAHNFVGTSREIAVSLGYGVTMMFVPIPPGEVAVGNQTGEGDRQKYKEKHTIKISKSLWIGKYEVTQSQWALIMGSNPSEPRVMNGPVNNIGWRDCQAYINGMNGMFTNVQFRLPSEAEWEYACRAGSSTKWYFGDNKEILGKYAWYLENAGAEIHEVGRLLTNKWGLYDMLGNVWEYCVVMHDAKSNGGNDRKEPMEPSVGENYVFRGGNIESDAEECMIATRGLCPAEGNVRMGFRLVMERK